MWNAACDVFAQMATFTELVILREEERVLMKIASKLNDQLNRLKVLHSAFVSLLAFIMTQPTVSKH